MKIRDFELCASHFDDTVNLTWLSVIILGEFYLVVYY